MSIVIPADFQTKRILAMVISGGQNGSDLAGVTAAKALGIRTGGTMPRGWTTLDGPKPEYAELFGMIESDKCGYEDRTLQNVRKSDFTLRVARWFNSPGERRTLKCIKQVHKTAYPLRYEDVTLIPGAKYKFETTDDDIRVIVTKLSNLCDVLDRPIVLNVAGNSERTAPGIGVLAEAFLKVLFQACLEKGR
jgi:hypothetical protein